MTWITQEFVVEFKDGSRDWVDPVLDVQETEDQIIVNNGMYDYKYDKLAITKWQVRDYSPETTYDEVKDR